ncbi:DUF4173 domain-containing protein [Pleomorphomonas oryzae]|uniref:DUF4153 domain-containing protein n=1 Tax=Pleomorphomonas oryzae TaxID=261934 RepID=UPI000413EBC8|nr:DUF4173 domain-containing protein [Pleomorphomonas oryzae]
MTLSAAEHRSIYVGPALWVRRRLVALGVLVAIADFLFYFEPAAGLPIALFLVLLFVSAAAFNQLRSSTIWRLAAAALLLAATVALIFDADPLSVPLAIGFSFVGAVLFVHGAVGWMPIARTALLLPLVGWLRLSRDLLRVRRAVIRRGGLRFDITSWIVPVGLSSFFLAVFLIANPVIDRWAILLQPDYPMGGYVQRVLFWMMTALVVWPFLHLVRKRRASKAPVCLPVMNGLWAGFLDDIAIRRSLISFNLLFALQTFTDLGYLWGGMALPEGMTHAEYAHRGAYPLMAAAMVAAAFVLIALRRRQGERHPRDLQPLLTVFVGQGLLLVASSMLRLDLYVEAYSLTLWRVAAFAWMGLVAFGFVTILIRIFKECSTRWLLGVNAGTALLTLWACCFVDFAGLVTSFNIAHSRQATGQGPDLDLIYLIHTFGPRAIPALDAHRDILAGHGDSLSVYNQNIGDYTSLDDWRDQAAIDVRTTDLGWRTWSFADWRLKRYLSQAPLWTVHEPR